MALTYLSALHKVIRNLASSQDVNELCHHAVSSLLHEFDIDRCGVLLFDEEKNEQIGTWGTDQFGHLREESHLRLPYDNSLIRYPDQGENGMILNIDHPLQELGEVVGKGWHVQCGIFDHDSLLGWLFVDNLVKRRGLIEGQIELIQTFAAAFGQMLVKFKQNKLLSSLNKNLESQNHYLEKALESLATAQQQLVEGEKMAALGKLVQGVAHELNTPLGNALVAISEIRQLTEQCSEKVRNKTLTQTDLSALIENITTAVELSESNAKRASNLVSQFKKIAISEEFDTLDEVFMEPFLSQFLKTIRDILPDLQNDVAINLLCLEDDLSWEIFPGAFTQVLTHLISNAQRHGLKNRPNGLIEIDIQQILRNGKPTLRIMFSDNGIGVDDNALKIIFDPFFTTNRQGGTGLGASIVYNLVTQRMKGSIQAKHNPGGGLQYVILLPKHPS